jgi:hypothetical protein
MPPNTLKIDRSTKWGNPYKVGLDAVHPVTRRMVHVATNTIAVELFAAHLQTAGGAEVATAAQRELRGKNLACWCRNGDACHGDVLLQLVNSKVQRRWAA